MPDPVLKGLDDWCQKSIGIRVYDYFCGCTRGGRLRVKIVLWDQNAKKKVMKGPNFDEKKQKNFAGKFAELSRKYQLNRDYQNESRLFICYDTIRDQLQHQILEMAGKDCFCLRERRMSGSFISILPVFIFFMRQKNRSGFMKRTDRTEYSRRNAPAFSNNMTFIRLLLMCSPVYLPAARHWMINMRAVCFFIRAEHG